VTPSQSRTVRENRGVERTGCSAKRRRRWRLIGATADGRDRVSFREIVTARGSVCGQGFVPTVRGLGRRVPTSLWAQSHPVTARPSRSGMSTGCGFAPNSLGLGPVSAELRMNEPEQGIKSREGGKVINFWRRKSADCTRRLKICGKRKYLRYGSTGRAKGEADAPNRQLVNRQKVD
jgi:hypothetical protein